MLIKSEKSKNTVFFPPKAQENSPLEVVQKTIDALIAYNQNYKMRVQSATPHELVEIFLSIYFNLDDLPPIKKNLSEFIKELKQNKAHIIEGAEEDINNYQSILRQIESRNYDLVYLSTHFFHQAWSKSLKPDVFAKTERLLAKFLEPKLVKKHSKIIAQKILRGNEDLPVTAEINTLAKLLKILKPNVSPACIRFVAGGTLEWDAATKAVRFELDREEKWQIDKSGKTLNELILQPNHQALTQFVKTAILLHKDNNDNVVKKMRDNLGEFSIHSENEIMLAQLYIDRMFALNDIVNLGSGTIFDKFINFYLAMSSMYQIEERINLFSRNFEKQKLEALKMEQKLKEKPKAVSIEKIEVPQPTKVQPIVIASTVPQIEVEETSSTIPQIEVQNHEEEASTEESIDPVKKVLNDMVSSEEPLEEPIEFYKPFYKKQEQKVLIEATLPRNLLKLEGDHLDTYLKVFKLKPYTSIGLRPLINLLTTHFGGKMGKSKGNRCCVKMNNIYAFITVPREPLDKLCNSATISMHGGGHRSTRSQNNDRGAAPEYLIDECRDALTRAGFTPINLGLDAHVTSESKP